MKRKLQRFNEIEAFPNVFQKDCLLKGKWNQEWFGREAPITLELGCGRGEYTLALHQKTPEANYIGVDIKGARLWRGAKTAVEENRAGIAFLRIQLESLTDYFSENEVSEIWITFPDPHPSQRRERKRLTSIRFLTYYQALLKHGGLIHLKTDAEDLFEYSQQCLYQLGGQMITTQRDIHGSELPEDSLLRVKTTYEQIFVAMGKPIHYLCYQITK